MRTTHVAIVRFIGTLVLIAALVPRAAAEDADVIRPEDAKSIRKLVDTFEAGWNALDAAAIGSIFRDDAEFINVVGMQWRGKAAIVKAHAIFLEMSFRNCKIKTDDVSIRSLGPDHALAVWVCTQDEFKTPAGDVVPKHQNRLTLVVVRDAKAGWQVVQAQNTRIDAGAARFDPVNKK